MEPTGILTAAGAVAIAAKQTQDFVAAITGNPGESIGTILGNVMKQKMDNAAAVVTRANLILLNIGVKAGEIPLNVLDETLKGAAVQSNPTIQETWANLLANAADPRGIVPVAAVFPIILKELTVREVKFLDTVYDDVAETARLKGREPKDCSKEFEDDDLRALYVKAGLSITPKYFLKGVQSDKAPDDNRSFDYMMTILKRNNLVNEQVFPRLLKTDEESYRRSEMDIELDSRYSLSPVGMCFVAACKAPA